METKSKYVTVFLLVAVVTLALIPTTKADDVTFGRTNEDADVGTTPSGYMGGMIFTLAEDAHINHVYAYILSALGGDYNVGAVIYSVSGGDPNALLAWSNATMHAAVSWVDFAVDVELTAGDYFLGIVAYVSGVQWRRTSGSSSCHWRTYTTIPDPYGSHSHSNYIYDIYATGDGIEEEDVYTLDLTVSSPENTTYDETIPVSLSVTGNDTNPVYSWNVKFTNGSWLYAINKTVTSYTMEIYENQTNCLFACTVIGDNLAEDYEEVYFSVLYITADAWDEDLNNYFCAAILLVFGFVFMVFMVSRRRY